MTASRILRLHSAQKQDIYVAAHHIVALEPGPQWTALLLTGGQKLYVGAHIDVVRELWADALGTTIIGPSEPPPE